MPASLICSYITNKQYCGAEAFSLLRYKMLRVERAHKHAWWECPGQLSWSARAVCGSLSSLKQLGQKSGSGKAMYSWEMTSLLHSIVTEGLKKSIGSQSLKVSFSLPHPLPVSSRLFQLLSVSSQHPLKMDMGLL